MTCFFLLLWLGHVRMTKEKCRYQKGPILGSGHSKSVKSQFFIYSKTTRNNPDSTDNSSMKPEKVNCFQFSRAFGY